VSATIIGLIAFQITSPIEMLVYSFTIIPAHALEVRFIVCKKFCFAVGEVGPVEIEVIFAALLFMAGYSGFDNLRSPLFSIMGIDFTIKLITTYCLVFLYFLFLIDLLKDPFM